MEDQIILIDKPLKWTSFDVVKAVRRRLKLKKVGHAGTLDPLATGLLVLCTGKATKEIESFKEQEKEYIGKIVIGQTTPSCDGETEVTPPVDISHIDAATVKRVATQFVGESRQVPPIYSAIKVDGKRAYKLAREGKTPLLKPRKIYISGFEVSSARLPEISFRVICSKGTYIRSLARDFGEAIGVGGYLSELRRVRIGRFRLEDAVSINQLQHEGV